MLLLDHQEPRRRPRLHRSRNAPFPAKERRIDVVQAVLSMQVQAEESSHRMQDGEIRMAHLQAAPIYPSLKNS